MQISVVGISHHTASVALRERVALSDNQARSLLGAMAAEHVMAESLVLATCNRTEAYFVLPDAPPRPDPKRYLLDRLAPFVGELAGLEAHLYVRDGHSAVEHLFRVSAGLDSQILGEHQILGQLKEAYRVAVELRATGLLLNRLMHQAFRAGKLVQTRTDLGRGSASVAQAAVEQARERLGELTGRQVLLIGAGRTAERAARAAIRGGARGVLVANRSIENARSLAETLRQPAQGKDADLSPHVSRCPALRRLAEKHAPSALPVSATEAPPAGPAVAVEAVGLDSLPSVLPRVDVIISSTAATTPVLTMEHAPALARDAGELCILDIAVPRDVDPRLGELPGVHLVNIDQLRQRVDESLDRRRRAVPEAERIIGEQLEHFVKWFDALEVAPTVRLLRRRFEQLQRRHIARYGGRFTEADHAQLQQFTRSLCNQILHGPMAAMRKLAEQDFNTEALAATDLLRQMFALDEIDDSAEPEPGLR